MTIYFDDYWNLKGCRRYPRRLRFARRQQATPRSRLAMRYVKKSGCSVSSDSNSGSSYVACGLHSVLSWARRRSRPSWARRRAAGDARKLRLPGSTPLGRQPIATASTHSLADTQLWEERDPLALHCAASTSERMLPRAPEGKHHEESTQRALQRLDVDDVRRCLRQVFVEDDAEAHHAGQGFWRHCRKLKNSLELRGERLLKVLQDCVGIGRGVLQ